MLNIKILIYNEYKVRITHIRGKRYWSLPDVGSIIGMRKYYNFSNRLAGDEKKTLTLGEHGLRMIFINESALYTFLKRYNSPKAVEFQNWIELELDENNAEEPIDENNIGIMQETKPSKPSYSIQARLQKAQMLIRIAEHKVTPQDEQLRLLDLAVQELTGAGIDASHVKSKISPSTTAEDDLMKLPEVIGCINKKHTENIRGCLIDFLPASLIAETWRTYSNQKAFDAKDFNEIANKNGYKTSKFGFWKKVSTPQGDAREFMYIDGTLIDYARRKFCF